MHLFNNTTCRITVRDCVPTVAVGVPGARAWDRNPLCANGIGRRDVKWRSACGIWMVVSCEKIENRFRKLDRCRAVVPIATSSVSVPPLGATHPPAMFEIPSGSIPLAFAVS